MERLAMEPPAEPPATEPPPPGPVERPPVPAGWFGRNWKRLAIAVVALFVVANVVRSVLPAIGMRTAGPNKPSSRASSVQPKNTPPATVDLNGVPVLGGGQPILTLNPGLVRPGTNVSVSGSGFDPGSKVDVLVSAPASQPPDGKPTDKAGKPGAGASKAPKAQQVASATAGKDGTISASFPFGTQAGGSSTREVTAQQRGSNTKVAKAEAILAQGTGMATLSDTTGRPGDTVSLSAEGFTPGEDLGVYWGRTTGEPYMTLHAGTDGSVSKASVQVGVAPVGDTSLFVVGKTSGSAASVPFQILGLYPTITVKPYAVKGAQPIGFSGKGFVPGERVLVHLNSAGGQPVLALPTDQGGGFSASNVVVPFALTGRQSLIFIGEQSRATATAGFMVLPYQPMVRASAYGGLPGTSITFYADGFAPNEAVHVFAGKTQGSQGDLVTAFRVDAKGHAGAGGSYMIPGDAPDGLTFTLVGAVSNGKGTATVKVDKSGGSADIPPQPKYVLPPDLQK